MTPLTEEDLPGVYEAFRARYRERDDRMAIMDAVVAGDWSVVDPDNEKVIARSPNLIQVAMEDTAEAAGSVPTTRVIPHRDTAPMKKIAGRMERIAMGYFDFAQMSLLITQTVMDMAAFGFSAWVVWPDFDARLPFIERRDPRYCYPEPGFRPGHEVKRCMFSRQVHYSQMPDDYQMKVTDFVTDSAGRLLQERLKFNLVEFFDANEILITAMFESSEPYVGGGDGVTSYVPVILDRIPVKAGVCPVVIGSRFTLDGEFRGQFDQIVGVLEAHVRLMGITMDYADQSVYSDIWVKDLIGELSWGGGAYIELGPQGAIGRVPPAVTSLNVAQDLDRLVDAIHLGGRWPKSRPGQVDQCLAPETRVLTDDLRWVPVGDLKEGQLIAGFDENLEGGKKPRHWRRSEVTHVGRAKLPSYRVKMADGTEIVASHGHKWLVRNNARHSYWLTTDELLKRFNSRRGIEVVKAIEPWEEDYTYEAGYLAGVLDGEGWLSDSRIHRGGAFTLGMAQRENAALAAVEVYAMEMGFDFRRYGTVGQNNDVQQVHLRGGSKEIARCLGSVRPKRLLQKWDESGGSGNMGRFTQTDVAVVEMEFIGDHEVVTLGTSTHTVVAEGYAHHNSIASAKFVEAVAGVMNTAIKTYHTLLGRMMEHALRVAFITDQKYFPGDKTISGVLRNQEFVEGYNPTVDIDVDNRIRVEYGLGLGRDPAQTAVLMLQYAEKDYISDEFVQENIDGLTDVARERVRTDTEKFQKMMMADLLQGLQAGQIPRDALVSIYNARSKGEALASLYDKYIVQPAAAAAQPPGGAPEMPPPGGPEGAPPGGPPGLPAPGQPLDGGPPAVPPPPNPEQMMSRLSVPIGGSRASFMSVGQGK